MNGSGVFVRSLVVAILVAGPVALAAQAPKEKPVDAKNYDEVFERYLSSARRLPMPANVWMADLATDPNARRVNDLVTVQVMESVSATGSADSNVGKNSSADVSLPLPKTWLDFSLGRVLPMSSETKFNGAGGTTRNTQLSATITARVIEVLPNGDLVVEGVREVDVNGDRSLIVLSGVVRPMDVMPGNVVPSPRIGQLRIRSLSQGLIKDSLTPGYLIRLLNKVF